MNRLARIMPLGALLALVPVAALADQELVRLRAGEHSGFSRIVVDVSDLGVWTSDQEERRLTLRFADRDFVFDAKQVYPARRVTRVLRAEGAQEEGDSILTLALACNCTTNVFTLGPRKLVIDVRDKSKEDNSPEEEKASSDPRDSAIVNAEATSVRTLSAARLPPAISAPAPRAARTTAPGAAPAPPPRPAANELQELFATAEPEGLEAASAADHETTVAVEPDDPSKRIPKNAEAEADVDVNTARLLLLEQLTRAAEQGLLEFRPDAPAPVGEVEATPKAEPTAAADDAGVAAEPAPDGAESRHEAENTTFEPHPPSSSDLTLTDAFDAVAAPQISARSVFDRDKPLASEKRAENAPFCVADRHLDIASWAEATPMADQIPALRTRLLGEFDKVDGEATLALARLYIHFGFGAEAEAVLRSLKDGGPRGAVKETATLLIDLARIIDGHAPTPDGPVAKSENCEGQIGVWRLAAGLGDAPPDDAALGDLITRAPILLRRVLAPRLVEALLDRGEVEIAGRVHALLARAGGDHGDAFRLAAARLAGAEGRITTAESGYSALIAGNSLLTDRALLYLSESLLARGAPAPPRLVGDLEAMAFLLRGTPIGRRLRVAEVRLRAGDGALLPTMIRIGQDMASDPLAAADLRIAAQDIWREARTAATDPVEYTRSAILYLDLVGDAADGDDPRIVAARELVAIGLPNLAIDALAPPLSRGSGEARHVAAAAYLSMLEPTQALALLADERGPDAQLLRARAHDLDGAYPVAFAALAEADGDAARAMRAATAWRGGDWSAAAALTDDPDRKAMAAFMARGAGLIAAPFAAIDVPPLNQPSPATVVDRVASVSEAVATARDRFLASPPRADAPSLALARRTLDLAEGARAFLNEVLTDG